MPSTNSVTSLVNQLYFVGIPASACACEKSVWLTTILSDLQSISKQHTLNRMLLPSTQPFAVWETIVHVSVYYTVMEDEGVTSVVVHTKFVYDVPIDAHYNMISYINIYLPLSLQPCITAQDLSWHQEHFVCSRCNTDLSQGGCTVIMS